MQLRNTFFSANPSSTPNSVSSSDIMDMDCTQIFKEFNAENPNILCNTLEEKVPSQREIIPEIAGTILQCRSGILRRKDNTTTTDAKEETWLFFLGPNEAQAKEKISRELAKIVFGSYSSFVSIGFLSGFVSSSKTRAVSSEDNCRNKRVRDEDSCMSYIERFAHAVLENPHRVFLVENLEQPDYFSQIGKKRAIERGRIINENGEAVGLSDAIVILSCESFSSRSRAASPKQKTEDGVADGGGVAEEAGSCVLLDLNISFDDETVEDRDIDDLGILENVDRRVVFTIQDL